MALVCGTSTVGDMVTEINNLTAIKADTNEPSGFIREDTTTMGSIEISITGTGYEKIAGDGTYSSVGTGTVFSDGTTAAARTLALTYDGVNTNYVYIEGEKTALTATQTVQWDNTTGLKYFYMNASGVLSVATTASGDYFEETPIVSVVYWNATTGAVIDWGDERHGVSMDGVTHKYLHFTEGTKYVSGMLPAGLTDGVATHGTVASGVMYDEDIEVATAAQATLPFWYLVGSEWTNATASNATGLINGADTYISWNEDTGAGVYALTEATATNDHVIMFILATHNAENPYVKIIGQTKYSSLSAAQSAILTEVETVSLSGLPSPEFMFVGAYIASRTGAVKTLSDGTSTFYDLREIHISGSGSASGALPAASDVSFSPAGDIAATDVQAALEELDDEKAKKELDLNDQTGTTYAPVLTDSDKVITLTNASAITVTIPANASVAYPIGTKLNFVQGGAGAVTIAITTDTLSVNSNFTLVLNGQYAMATAVKLTSTTWVLTGNLVGA